MSVQEIRDVAVTLDCLLNCLAAIDADNTIAVSNLPHTLRIATKYSFQLCEALEIMDRD